MGRRTADMRLTGDDLLNLWESSSSFEQVAVKAFGQDIPNRSASEGITDEELAAYKALQDALLNGRFIGIGFPEPRRLGDLPLEIPRDAWAPDPDNLRLGFPDFSGRLTYGEFSYSDVRVAPHAEHLTRTEGRPTLGPLFEEAIAQMVLDGEIDVTKEQAQHFPKVRQRAKQMFPLHKAQIDKASSRTVAKYFSPFYNDLLNRLE